MLLYKSLTLHANRYLLAVLSIIFLIFMHTFMPNLGGVMSQPREFIIWIGIFTIILLSILKILHDKTMILPSYLTYVLMFVALLLSSSIFNPIKNMDMFIIDALHLIAAVLLYLSLHQFNLKERERETLLLIILASVVIESVIGIMQFFELYKYIPITPAPEARMIGGVFQQKNLFASWMATGLVISLYFITTDRFKILSRFLKTTIFISVAVLSMNLILVSSGAGLLGFAIGSVGLLGFATGIMVILLTRFNLYKVSKGQTLTWCTSFILGAVIGIFLFSGKGGVSDYAYLMSKGKKASIMQRGIMYRTSFEMFKEKPLFGQGFGNFGSLYMYHQAKVIKSEQKYRELISDYTYHPHNEIFKIMAESGIAGILAILIVIVGFVRMLYKLGLQHAGLYTALLMPLLVHIMVEYPLELSTSHYLVFLIFLYMGTSNIVKERRLNPKKSVVILTVFISVLMYLTVTGYTIKTFDDYMNMVIYQREYDEGKTPSEKNIEGAMNNIYLRNWAKPQYMYVKAENAAKEVGRNIDFLNNFLEWSSLEKQRQPVKMVFYSDAMVLYSMGIYFKKLVYFDEAMKTVEEGLLLYPNDEYLKALRPKIVSETIRVISQAVQQQKK